MLSIIKIYQYLFSPLISIIFGYSVKCRFYPTCSNYALECYKLYGVRKASWLTLLRLFRCQPFFKSGFDPVPKASKFLIKNH